MMPKILSDDKFNLSKAQDINTTLIKFYYGDHFASMKRSMVKNYSWGWHKHKQLQIVKSQRIERFLMEGLFRMIKYVECHQTSDQVSMSFGFISGELDREFLEYLLGKHWADPFSWLCTCLRRYICKDRLLLELYSHTRFSCFCRVSRVTCWN